MHDAGTEPDMARIAELRRLCNESVDATSPEIQLALLRLHVRTLLEYCDPYPTALELGGWINLDGRAWATRAAELIGMDLSEIGRKG